MKVNKPTLKRRFDNNEQENESKKLNLWSTEDSNSSLVLFLSK